MDIASIIKRQAEATPEQKRLMESVVQLGEWEMKGLVRKYLGATSDDEIRGHAYAAYVEEELQWMALKYEWEVLGFRKEDYTEDHTRI